VSVADRKILKGGTEDNLSAPSSFIANVHNGIYAFYTEKAAFFEKKYEPIKGGAAAPTAPTAPVEKWFPYGLLF